MDRGKYANNEERFPKRKAELAILNTRETLTCQQAGTQNATVCYKVMHSEWHNCNLLGQWNSGKAEMRYK